MPLTFKKRIKVFPGVYLNVGKRAISVTQKVGPVTTTRRKGRNPRVTVNIPGPVGYTTGGGVRRPAKAKTKAPPKRKPEPKAKPSRSPERIVRPDAGFDPYS